MAKATATTADKHQPFGRRPGLRRARRDCAMTNPSSAENPRESRHRHGVGLALAAAACFALGQVLIQFGLRTVPSWRSPLYSIGGSALLAWLFAMVFVDFRQLDLQAAVETDQMFTIPAVRFAEAPASLEIDPSQSNRAFVGGLATERLSTGSTSPTPK